METLLGGHSRGQHLQADGTGELGLEILGGDRDLCVVCDRLLRGPVQLVQREVPVLPGELRHGILWTLSWSENARLV